MDRLATLRKELGLESGASDANSRDVDAEGRLSSGTYGIGNTVMESAVQVDKVSRMNHSFFWHTWITHEHVSLRSNDSLARYSRLSNNYMSSNALGWGAGKG